MRRNYKLVLSIIVVLLTGAFAYSQEKETEYKEVVLDGKPAKLNLATGEITFINPNDKKNPIKLDDYVATKAAVENTQQTDKNSIAGLHVVQEGETLFDISKYYKVSLNKLKEENNLETTLINKGQTLRVKNFDAVNIKDSQTNSRSSYVSNQGNTVSNIHTVEKGETLFRLAKQYNLSLQELKDLNNLSSNIITVGQKLQVKENAAETSISEYTNASESIWVVSKGDTLFSIAKKNGLTVNELKRLNGLSRNTIYVGQKLHVD